MHNLRMHNGVVLTFWLEKNTENTIATVWVKKHGNDEEKYRVFSISSRGECWRHRGLPVGWGFRLTADRKIKEIA